MTLLPESIYFLSVEEVKEIHANQIDNYGGSHGVRKGIGLTLLRGC